MSLQDFNLFYGLEPKSAKRLRAGLIVFSIIAIILIAWGSFAQVYKNRFFPNVKILGIDIGGQDKKTALNNLNARLTEVEKRKITLKAGDGETDAKLETIGVNISADDAVAEAAFWGRNKNLALQLKEIFSLIMVVEINPDVEINNQVFEKYLSDYVHKNTSEVKQPELVIENAQVKIIEGKAGTAINQKKLTQDLINLAKQTSGGIIAVDTIHVDPEDPNSDKYLNAKKQAEIMMDKTISLNYEGKVFVANKTVVSKWIVFSREENRINVNYSDAAILTWISYVALSVDVAAKPHILNYKGEVVTAGEDGKALDRNNAFYKIKSALKSPNKTASYDLKVDPVTPPIERQTSMEGPNPGMAEGHYIEVDISQQMLYLFDGTSLAGGYRVSTGMSVMPTPVGNFSVLNKSPRAYSTQYGLYMPWWNGFTAAGHGIHELPEWPDGTKEGEWHLGIPVSHGCIRLGVGAAQVVYDFSPIGTPVFIHM